MIIVRVLALLFILMFLILFNVKAGQSIIMGQMVGAAGGATTATPMIIQQPANPGHMLVLRPNAPLQTAAPTLVPIAAQPGLQPGQIILQGNQPRGILNQQVKLIPQNQVQMQYF